MYKALGEDEYELSETEREIMRLCVNNALEEKCDLTIDDVFEWYPDAPFNKDRLRSIIEEKIDVKLRAKEDQTEQVPMTESLMDFIYTDIFDGEEDKGQIYKLVEHYKNELKFEEVQGVTILKPSYDFLCFSLLQPIDILKDNRIAAWIQHSDIDSED